MPTELERLKEKEKKLLENVRLITPIYRKRRRLLSQADLLLGQQIKLLHENREMILALEGKIHKLPYRDGKPKAPKPKDPLAEVRKYLNKLSPTEREAFLSALA